MKATAPPEPPLLVRIYLCFTQPRLWMKARRVSKFAVEACNAESSSFEILWNYSDHLWDQLFKPYTSKRR